MTALLWREKQRISEGNMTGIKKLGLHFWGYNLTTLQFGNIHESRSLLIQKKNTFKKER